jgi:sugar-specific transcriptional regulator TrmB
MNSLLFQKLGLSQKETRAFLKMLELGPQPVSIIARYVGVPRSSMYVILERLHKLELVEHFDRGGITFFRCIPVKNIAGIISEQKNTLEYTLKLLDEALPELESKENKLSITPKVRFFEGEAGAKKMYEEVLKEKSFYAAFNPELMKKKMPEYVYKIPEMLKSNECKAKELLTDSAEAKSYKKTFNSKNHEIKILPKGATFASDTIICENRIFMIAYGEDQISATEIVNPSLAQTQRVLFEQLWERL